MPAKMPVSRNGWLYNGCVNRESFVNPENFADYNHDLQTERAIVARSAHCPVPASRTPHLLDWTSTHPVARTPMAIESINGRLPYSDNQSGQTLVEQCPSDALDEDDYIRLMIT